MAENNTYVVPERVYKNTNGNATLDSRDGQNELLFECGSVTSEGDAKKFNLPELFKKSDVNALKNAAEVAPQSVTPDALKDAKAAVK